MLTNHKSPDIYGLFTTRSAKINKMTNLKISKNTKIKGTLFSESFDFPLIKKQTKQNMGLKHWILPKDHFKTHLFFSIFGWGDPFQLGSWSEGCFKPLKLSREAI